MCAHGGQHEPGGARPRLRHGGGEGLVHGPRTPGVGAIDVPAGHGAKGRHHPRSPAAAQWQLLCARMRGSPVHWLWPAVPDMRLQCRICCRCLLAVTIFCRF
eukprot:COSAG01_NODE_1197_length_11296_cov_113.645262_5_plen_102_part_00